MRFARLGGRTSVASLALAALLLAAAAPARAQDYAIKLTRPSKAGDAYRLTANATMKRTVVVTANGREVNRQAIDYKVSLVGDVKVLEAAANGTEQKLAVTVTKCEQTAGDKTRELVKPGAVLTVARQGKESVYSTEAGPLAADATEPLNLVLRVSDPNDPNDDATFGTAERKKVGATWDAKKDAIVAGITSSGMPLDKATAAGTATLTGVKQVGGVECAVVQYTTTAKASAGAPMPDAPPWAKLLSGGMDVKGTKTVPTNPALPEVADEGTMTMTIKAGGTSPEGAVIVMEITGEGTRQFAYEHKK